MILTHQLIGHGLTFQDVGADWKTHQYSTADVVGMVHAYKNLLQHTYHCRPGQRVVIALAASVSQVALMFACAELALTIVIVDHEAPHGGALRDYIYKETQTLLPIDFLFIESQDRLQGHHKFSVYQEICDITVVLQECELDYLPNHTVWAQDNTKLIVFNSSGKSCPTVVSHTHNFIVSLALRNSKQFRGTVGMCFNLQHGSSLATYFLPALMSTAVTGMINFQAKESDPEYFVRISKHGMNHLMIPYGSMLFRFFEACQDHANPELIIHTLGFISPSYLSYLNRGRAQNVVSIFGSGETSGAVFVNQLLPFEQFDPRRYHKVDNFYEVSLDDNGIMTVCVPQHNLKVVTNDCFEYQNNSYYYRGRADLVRINNWPVDLDRYNNMVGLIAGKNCSEIVLDLVEDCMYLVTWTAPNLTKQQLDSLNYQLGHTSGWAHKILKYAALDPATYRNNTEQTLQYFRQFVPCINT